MTHNWTWRRENHLTGTFAN